MPPSSSTRARIYAVTRLIPPGLVATYGQIARIAGGCTARMVGYAMASLPPGSDVPWQRVINAQGRVSPHGAGFGSAMQRALLEDEGILFDPGGRIDLGRYRWPGLLHEDSSVDPNQETGLPCASDPI